MPSLWLAELRDYLALFNRIRPWLGRRYWWSVFPLLCILTVLVACGGLNEVSAIPIAAIAMGFIYFVQKQRLAELTLFNALFREFNERYDRFNGRLRRIMASQKDLTPGQSVVLENYFNLCSEEYFYFKHGIIDDLIWRSWCRGMLRYLEDDRIRAQWMVEETVDSHYGLTLEIIRAGAGVAEVEERETQLVQREAA